ncbi:MAG: flap structure-specific endonuclease, partial [Thermoprotei archaeon]
SLQNALKVLPKEVFLVDPQEIKKLFLKPEVTDKYELEWREPNVEGVISFLCGEHDFSRGRVENALRRAVKAVRELRIQTSLDAWFS